MAGYIGSKASVVSSGAERKKTFAITTNTTSLTGLSYTVGQVHVFHNGVRLVDGTDYTATDGTSITLTSAAENGDEVVVISYAAFQTGDTVSASAGGTFAGDVNFTGNVSVDGGTIKLDGNYPVGTGNVALGDTALDSNVSGVSNTAIGADALTANTASNSTAVGYQAGYAATVGGYNTFIGHQSGLASNHTSDAFANNTFVGALSGSTVTTGRKNTVLGLYNGNQDGLDIRTASNRIVLSDGDGSIGLYIDNSQDAHFDGNVIAYSTTISDERLKTDIVKIDSALDKLEQINGYTFTYTADGKKSAGVIAQEVERVLPSAVNETAMPLKTGNDDLYKSVQYDQLIGLLVEAVKELKAEVAELKGA